MTRPVDRLKEAVCELRIMLDGDESLSTGSVETLHHMVSAASAMVDLIEDQQKQIDALSLSMTSVNNRVSCILNGMRPDS